MRAAELATAREIIIFVAAPSSGIGDPTRKPILGTAELTKHAVHAFLSTRIPLINVVADICQAVGTDVSQAAQGIGLDPRIGTAFLNARHTTAKPESCRRSSPLAGSC